MFIILYPYKTLSYTFFFKDYFKKFSNFQIKSYVTSYVNNWRMHQSFIESSKKNLIEIINKIRFDFIWQILYKTFLFEMYKCSTILILKNRYEQSLFYQTDSSTWLLWLLLWLARTIWTSSKKFKIILFVIKSNISF